MIRTCLKPGERRCRAGLCVLLVCLAGVSFAMASGAALAASPSGADAGSGTTSGARSPIPWSMLDPDEQRVLRPLAETWDELTPQRQERLRKGARRWLRLSPEERRHVRRRFQRWQQLSPEVRQRVRERYLRFLALPPERRRQLSERYRRFQQLPPAQRHELRQRWHRMTPEERHRFLERKRERKRDGKWDRNLRHPHPGGLRQAPRVPPSSLPPSLRERPFPRGDRPGAPRRERLPQRPGR